MFKSRNLFSTYKKYGECFKSVRGQIQMQEGKYKRLKTVRKFYDNYSNKINYSDFMQKTVSLGKYSNAVITTVLNRFSRNGEEGVKIIFSDLNEKTKSFEKNDKEFITSTANRFKNNSKKCVSEKIQKLNPYLFASAITGNAESKNSVSDPIPDPPPIPESPVLSETITELVNEFNALGEPTFASLGLGGWTPVGIVQTCMEYLHVTLGIPWWQAIVIGTIIIRTLMLPLVIIAQRNSARMNNYLPQLQTIQLKLTEARQTGNELEVARYSQELMIFMKEKGLNPLKNMIVPLAQMPIFISFFMGLREMASTPVESLKTGGIFWFKDLTLPDQYYAMPIITSLTLWATIELGTDSAKLSAQNMQVMSYVLRALPLVILPFTVNFPGVILCYWVSSNFISLLQVSVLRMPVVRDYFNIEPLIKHNPENLPIKKKGFTEGLQESWTNIKLSKELEERKRLDEIQFQRAGKGPIVKTYKYDPTKQIPSNASNAISAKKR